jgi:hypothetical protein
MTQDTNAIVTLVTKILAPLPTCRDASLAQSTPSSLLVALVFAKPVQETKILLELKELFLASVAQVSDRIS